MPYPKWKLTSSEGKERKKTHVCILSSKGCWSAKEWRGKESESKWSIICAGRREAAEGGRKLLGHVDRQLSDNQDKCRDIQSSGRECMQTYFEN